MISYEKQITYICVTLYICRTMRPFLFICLLWCLSSCKNTSTPTEPNPKDALTPMSELKQLTAITADGQIMLADGTSMSIPHYGDQNYLILYLVRHAEKDNSNPDNPPLTAEGVARAERLGRIMDNAVLDKVTSTNTRRTMDTALAVKRWAGDPVMETFPVAAQNDWLIETLSTGGGKRVFHVGHQNTVPAMLNALTGTLHYKSMADYEYGRFYIAITKGTGQTEVIELKY
jgi:2,3-bisphosphoglycerate-dependent phosphoglycerate mutase